jgi:2-polyprenyl-6-methoxyphenol hydroxylase-like FAD-dependent oxidoreductase
MPSTIEDRRDVLIVGGGFAGSVLALSLARRGVGVGIVDLHRTYGSDFRCEKFKPDQARLLGELGALECLASDAESLTRTGMRYEQMVNRVRGAWPAEVAFHEARVVAIDAGEAVQNVLLSTGAALSGRLVVLATGRGERLRRSLGIGRRLLRERHSLCIGFTLEGATGLPAEGLVHHGERAGDGIAFASLFPMGGAMRVNLFSYRDPAGAWARSFRGDPLGALRQTFPKLAPMLEGATAAGGAEFGITDLYEAQDYVRPGVVVIGDAFRSSCPATGMGLTRVLTDVRQLSELHIPAWLAMPGMHAGKIAAFYADPAKAAVEQHSRRTAESGRSAATDTSLRWRAYRALSRARRAGRAALAGLPALAGARA